METMSMRVVAHRGASADLAEHTLGAYAAALDDGADGVECDVRLTADGHLVCVHDRDLRRTAATPRLISTSNLEELDELDVASWKHPWADLDEDRPLRDERLDRLLTLRGLLELVADYERPVEVAIETKHPTRYSGLVERRLVEELRRFGWDRAGTPVRVMSFSRKALHRVERLAPALQLVQLLERAHQWPVLSPLIGPDWLVGPSVRLLAEHPRLGPRISAAGHRMHVWTVNTAADLDLCVSLGVEAIITDRPRWAKEELARRGAAAAERPGAPARHDDRREDAAG